MSVPDTFYAVDVLFGLFVLLFGVVGLLRGLADELARLLAFAFLLCGFAVFFPALTQFAARNWVTLSLAAVQVVVGLVLWMSAMLLFFMLRFSLKKLLCEQVDSLLNKLSGALVGLLSGALLGLSVLSVVSLVPDESVYQKLSEKSVVGGWVCERMTPWLHPRLMELPVFDREEN
ncbi:MAG: CvpA family protein [Kiritimatiellales bacterium]|nr:CvpA family protein [Kiritimatiellota bacterium]MBL7012279.1 CvpA family protein [Kiritimatiellales bacterium]